MLNNKHKVPQQRSDAVDKIEIFSLLRPLSCLVGRFLSIGSSVVDVSISSARYLRVSKA